MHAEGGLKRKFEEMELLPGLKRTILTDTAAAAQPLLPKQDKVERDAKQERDTDDAQGTADASDSTKDTDEEDQEDQGRDVGAKPDKDKAPHKLDAFAMQRDGDEDEDEVEEGEAVIRER